MASSEEIQPLSWRVLDIIIERIHGLIGAGALGVLTTLDGADRSQPPDPRIVYDLGNEMGDLFGNKGAFAILRQVGREIGRMFSDGTNPLEAREILQVTLRELGFAYEIKLSETDAHICRCVFYDLLKADGHGPIRRPVCWMGWGFIEGCLKNVNGAHHVQWQDRDEAAQACRFAIRKTADDYEPTR